MNSLMEFELILCFTLPLTCIKCRVHCSQFWLDWWQLAWPVSGTCFPNNIFIEVERSTTFYPFYSLAILFLLFKISLASRDFFFFAGNGRGYTVSISEIHVFLLLEIEHIKSQLKVKNVKVFQNLRDFTCDFQWYGPVFRFCWWLIL